MIARGTLLSFGLWIVLLAFVRVAVIPPESCGVESEERIAEAAEAAAAWMTRNQNADGTYVYLYYNDSDIVPAAYNEVRHAGVTMSLYQAAGRLGDREALATADNALAWMEDHLVRHDDWAALTAGFRADSPPLGASALMVVSMAERRLATAETQSPERSAQP